MKMFLIFLVALLRIVGRAAMANPYNATVNGINQEFTYVTVSFNANSPHLQRQPWWGSESTAITFASSVGG